MKLHWSLLILGTLGLALAEAASGAQSEPDSRAAVAKFLPGVKAEDLKQSPIPGIFEVARGTNIAYVSSDGRYAIAGDLYDLRSNDNLTESRRREARLKVLSSVPESEMVIFGPRNPKYTITVFTDIDCSYCRKLHTQIAEYNRLGIRVRYMFYPRTGPNTESWKKADEVWCSDNRADALTRAKRGEALPDKACPSSPVERHYAIGRDFALQGTPAIVTNTGEMLPGYIPPLTLAQHLQQPASR